MRVFFELTVGDLYKNNKNFIHKNAKPSINLVLFLTWPSYCSYLKMRKHMRRLFLIFLVLIGKQKNLFVFFYLLSLTKCITTNILIQERKTNKFKFFFQNLYNKYR